MPHAGSLHVRLHIGDCSVVWRTDRREFVELFGDLSDSLFKTILLALVGVDGCASIGAFAVAVLLAYGVALRDTLLIILVAYLAKFWALGFRPVAAGLDGIPADSYRAARVSGLGRQCALAHGDAHQRRHRNRQRFD